MFREPLPLLRAEVERVFYNDFIPKQEPAKNLDTIGTLWIGRRLAPFYQLCVRSWLANGYRVNFFQYEPVEGVPAGCNIRDAREILPYEKLFSSAPDLDSRPFTRANIFRLAMIAAGQGIWCDTDYLMLRPFRPARNIIVGREQNGKICNAILWFPPDFELAPRVLESFTRRDLPAWSYSVTYGRAFWYAAQGKKVPAANFPKHHWGRHTLEFFVRKHRLEPEVSPYPAFYWPVIYDLRMYKASEPYEHIVENEEVLGLHFFRKSAEAFEHPEPGSFFHWAKQHYA